MQFNMKYRWRKKRVLRTVSLVQEDPRLVLLSPSVADAVAVVVVSEFVSVLASPALDGVVASSAASHLRWLRDIGRKLWLLSVFNRRFFLGIN